MTLTQLNLKDLSEEVPQTQSDVMIAAPPNVSSSSSSYMFMGNSLMLMVPNEVDCDLSDLDRPLPPLNLELALIDTGASNHNF